MERSTRERKMHETDPRTRLMDLLGNENEVNVRDLLLFLPFALHRLQLLLEQVSAPQLSDRSLDGTYDLDVGEPEDDEVL